MSKKEFGSSPVDYVDPAWDYASIYPELEAVQTTLNIITEEIAGTENATPEIDKALKESIDQLISKLQSVRAKLG